MTLPDRGALPGSGLPFLLFSEDGALCDERGVVTKMPELSDKGELRHLFLKSLGRSRDGFLRFCAASADKPAFRLYTLSSAGPFRAAFAEKAVLLSTPVTAVFLASSVTAFYRLMSPSSVYAADAVNRILFELTYLMHGGSPVFSSLSPEIFAVAARIPRLAESLFSRRCGVRCCDLWKILTALTTSLRTVPALACCRVELRRADPYSVLFGDRFPPDCEAEVSVEAFVSVLCALLCLAADLTADGELTLTLTDHGVVREASLTLRTGCLSPREAEEGADALYALPEHYHGHVRYITALCALTDMDLSVRCRREADETFSTLTVSLLLGGEPPPLLDFKYDEPERAVPLILAETAALFAPSVPPGQQDQTEKERLGPGSVR